MKILIDPKMAILIRDFTDAECAELLRCIFEYPNRDCELGVWQYMKTQIDIDAQKYQEKCRRMAENRKKKSSMKSTMISEEIEEENIINNKINDKCSESGKAAQAVENSVETYQISEAFAFQVICDAKPAFAKYLTFFPPAVVERAEKTMKKKRAGQWLSMQQILDWIDQEHQFYKQNHGE